MLVCRYRAKLFGLTNKKHHNSAYVSRLILHLVCMKRRWKIKEILKGKLLSSQETHKVYSQVRQQSCSGNIPKSSIYLIIFMEDPGRAKNENFKIHTHGIYLN